MRSFGLLTVIVLAVYIAHLSRGWRLRKRIAKWSKDRISMTDDKFYSVLQPTAVTRDGALAVRALVADAVRIPVVLVYPDDTLSELKKVGDPSHPSVMDYVLDVTSIKRYEEEDALTTVRDFCSEVRAGVVEFGAKPQRPNPK